MKDLSAIDTRPLNATQKEFLSLLLKAGWSQAEAARQLKVSRAMVTQTLNGKTTPEPATMELLRVKSAPVKYPVREEAVIVQETPSQSEKEKASDWAARIGKETARRLGAKIRFAPRIAEACAGAGKEYFDLGLDVDWFPTHCRDENCYALLVDGRSMEPRYRHGDVIIVAPNGAVRNKDLVVARIPSGGTVFKVFFWSHRKEDKVVLSSLNEDQAQFPPIMFFRHELGFLQPVHSVLRIERKDL